MRNLNGNLKFPRPTYRMDYAEDGNDTATHTFSVRLNKADRKAVLKDRRGFIMECRERGILPDPGCHCSHCQNGYDCCGRMFPNGVKVRPAKRGVRIIQNYSRNI